MKRSILFCIVVGLFAGSASADFYTMDVPTADDLTYVDVSAGDTATLKYIGYNDGTDSSDYIAGPQSSYGGEHPMYYAVGFAAFLEDTGTTDGAAWMKFGLTDVSDLTTLGSFEGFYLPIANDNNSGWQYKLYVETTGDDYISDDWTPIDEGMYTTLYLDFFTDNTEIDFGTLEGIGFLVGFADKSNSYSDTLHTSVVPVPAAVILGILGLGVAGIKLRKYA